MTSVETWKSELSNLPAAQRSERAHDLLESLKTNETNARAEWLALAKQRMADVRAGKIIGIAAKDVLDRLAGAKQ